MGSVDIDVDADLRIAEYLRALMFGCEGRATGMTCESAIFTVKLDGSVASAFFKL